jgi:hypothetical protein
VVRRAVRWAAALTAVGVLAGGVALAWGYLRIHARPDGLFEPRRHSPQRLHVWRQELWQRVGAFETALAEGKAARLELTEPMINAWLVGDPWAAKFWPADWPVSPWDVRVSLRPGRAAISAETAVPDGGADRVIVSVIVAVRPPAAPDGGFATELEEMLVGRQPVPRSAVESRLAERRAADEATEAAGSAQPDPPGVTVLRTPGRLVRALAAGRPLGPILEVPGKGRGGGPLRMRLKELTIDAGRLIVALEPLPPGSAPSAAPTAPAPVPVPPQPPAIPQAPEVPRTAPVPAAPGKR